MILEKQKIDKTKNMKQKIAIFILILTYASNILAQTEYMPKVVPPSPNASSLGKFVDIPVSYHTGIPNINIPIWDVKAREGLSLPISVSYHSGGIKVEEIASWVGLGWSLNAGGCITRSVVGIADESHFGYLNNNITYSDVINYTESEQISLYNSIQSESTDLEPDNFYFNFANHTGRLIIDKSNNEIYTVPYYNWKIESNEDFTQFTIVTEDGTEYIFGKSWNNARTANEITTSFTYSDVRPVTSPQTYISTWYLTDIFSPNGIGHIQLFYETFDITYCLRNSMVRRYAERFRGCAQSHSPSGSSTSTTDISINACRLTQISSSQVDVYFNKGDERTDLSGDYVLDNIRINNKQNNIRYFYFGYDYFYASGGLSSNSCTLTDENSRRYRLKLTSITERFGLEEKPPYLFEYNNQQLPERLSNSVDHWGYYNGQNGSGNQNLVPYMEFQNLFGTITQLDGANRTPHPEAVKAGLLESIVYPTGGRTEFYYENHVAYTTDFDFEASLSSNWEQKFRLNSSNLSQSFNHDGSKVKIVVRDYNTYSNNKCSFDVRCYDGTMGDCGYYINIYSGGSLLWRTSGEVRDGYMEWELDDINLTGSITVELDACSQSTGIEDVFVTVYNCPTCNNNLSLPYDKTIGGARIKEIRHIDNINENNTISYLYKYEVDGHSSGLITRKPKYDYFTYYLMGPPCDGLFSEYRVFNRLAVSQVPLTYAQGSHIGYSHVQVYNKKINGPTGKTEYEYTSTIDYPDNSVGSSSFPFPPPVIYDWKRGKLKRESNYSYNNGYTEVSRIENEYSSKYGAFRKRIDGIKIGITSFSGSVYGGAIISDYSMLTHGFYKSRTIKKHFYNGNSLIISTDYYYDNDDYFILSKIEKTESDGIITETEFNYPFNYPDNSLLMDMVNENMLNPVVEQITTRDEVQIDGIIQNYNIYNTNDYFTSSVEKFDEDVYNTKITYDDYDQYGNLLQYTNNETGLSNTIIWDEYGNPKAEAINAIKEHVFYTSFEEGNGDISDKKYSLTGNIFKTAGYSLANQFSDNVRTGQDYILTYWWKASLVDNWELQKEYYNNFTEGTTISTSKTTGYIDELRFHPKMSKINTFVYKPLIGITSNNDQNNVITFYEYDQLGRLTVVRDQNKKVLKAIDYNYGDGTGCYLTLNINNNYSDVSTPISFSLEGNCELDANTRVLWDFGDGATSNAVSLTNSHLYSSAGTYNVSVNLIDEDIGEFMFEKEVVVTTPTPSCNLDFTVESNTYTATIDCSLSDDAVYIWNFNDGTGDIIDDNEIHYNFATCGCDRGCTLPVTVTVIDETNNIYESVTKDMDCTGGR